MAGADPELCISLLHRGLNFSGLKGRLRSADQQWIESFLEHGGLTAIFDAMEVLGSRGFSSMADALRQLDCVACVKAVMNSTFGLDFIIHYPEKKYVRKLSEGEQDSFVCAARIMLSCSPVQEFDSNNRLVKVQVFELLSALAVYSQEGHALALDALEHHKVRLVLRVCIVSLAVYGVCRLLQKRSGQAHRFSKLLQELRGSETEEFSACILALVNCLIAGADGIDQRVRIRNQLLGEGCNYLLAVAQTLQ